MKILMVTPEVDPFVKVGGLADVVGSLSKELTRLGHDVRIVCPLHGSIRQDPSWQAHDRPLWVDLGAGREGAKVWETRLPRSATPVYFLENFQHYGRPEIYHGPWGAHADNDRRFAFLCRAALNLCLNLDWLPDVIHGHDWTTGLVPVYLNTTDRDGPLGRAASVFTIHNLEHQGYCDRSLLDYAHVPWSEFRADSLESMGAVNLMKAGLYHATKLTTVSPAYAREIQTPAFGCGLDDVLRFRSADLIGILNGIDEEVWNPATDPLLPAHYAAGDFAGKAACKAALQETLGLPPEPNIILCGVVSRLFAQKGLDLLAAILPEVLEQMAVQFVLLGTGEAALEQAFREIAARHPGRVGLKIGFDNRLAHLIEAGSDCFVMPSRFEPCGLNQLYSLRYGTLPLVRATGGLVDTVENYREGDATGTGFVFEHPTPPALYYTIGWAVSTYYDRPDDFQQLRRNAMARDSSWRGPARHYEDVYRWAVAARHGGAAHISASPTTGNRP